MGYVVVLAMALGPTLSACAPNRVPEPTASRDEKVALLAPSRLAALPADRRAAWESYVARSRERYDRDTAAFRAELRAAGRTEAVAAPRGSGFSVEKEMTPVWLASDSGRRVADIVLSYQAPNGGWSKRVEMTVQPRQPGESYFSETKEWRWISTFDNGATTSQLRFLALADAARPDERYRTAFMRGLEYLLEAQAPNGCWPQIYPLAGDYHDAITFNDDAAVNAASVLRDVADGDVSFVAETDRARARAALERVVECMLASQIVVDGKPTIWGQQHDPLTFAPIAARSYEPASLAAQESAGIVRFLITLPSPSPRVASAVHGAIDWFRATEIRGYAYDFENGRREAAGEGPLWARLYEIGTNRPIFSNRDGVILYDYEQLTDRRRGYAWYTYSPVLMLRQYERWARRNPRAEQ